MKTSRFVALGLIAATAAPLPQAQAQAKPVAKKAATSPLPKGIGGVWTIDPLHSRVGFSIRHVMVNDVHGQFKDFSGTIKVDEKNIPRSSVEFTAKVASIDTAVPKRDEHLRSPDFFDAKKYPNLTFKSNRIERTANGFKAYGTFTMHGVSKPLVIPFTVRGPIDDGWDSWRAGITSTLYINRLDYGVKYNQVLDNGGLALGNMVKVNLDLEAMKAVAKKAVAKKAVPKKP
jgi:polyisoprenoid-binding protein YceI